MSYVHDSITKELADATARIAVLEEQNRKLREIIDAQYETCALVKPAYALTGHFMKPVKLEFHMELLDQEG